MNTFPIVLPTSIAEFLMGTTLTQGNPHFIGRHITLAHCITALMGLIGLDNIGLDNDSLPDWSQTII